jgi:hypothetical protein
MPAQKETHKTATKNGFWSQHVTETSNALDLQAGVFALSNPREIALSLKKSADASSRRKSEPFRSAMSMLTFYINRAGRILPEAQRERLEAAKDELRVLYGRPRQISRYSKRSSE